MLETVHNERERTNLGSVGFLYHRLMSFIHIKVCIDKDKKNCRDFSSKP